jgi:thymidylate kinase
MKQDSKIIFRSLPDRFEVLHHRPHIFPNISQIFKKEINEKEVFDLNFNPHSGKASNPFVSFFKLLYYAFDYILGYAIKIMPLQRKNKFIIFDRYYFDFIVDQKRSALYVPRYIAIAIYKILIPKPNKIFFIKVDPQEAHNRKKELPVKMIAEINNKYEVLSHQLENFVVIPNENLKKAYSDFIKNIILVITHNVDNK